MKTERPAKPVAAWVWPAAAVVRVPVLCLAEAAQPLGGKLRCIRLALTSVRCRSTWATYAGMVCGLAGTAAIVAAFAWPAS